MNMKKYSIIFSLFAAAAMLLAACGPAATTVAPPPPATQAPAPVQPTAVPTEAVPVLVATNTPNPFKVGFVTDTAGIADKSFNQTQWEGIERAGQVFGISVKYIQSTEASQYTPNLTEFASQGYDLVIAAGFFLGGDLAKVAAQYPNTKFAIADYSYPSPFDVPEGVVGHAECIPNVMGEVFKTDQPAYMAGYLAAGMAMKLDPTDPKVGYFGGAKIPTVTIFGVGLQMGLEAYNAKHNTTVKLLGWDNKTGEGSFTNDFVDMTKAQQAAQSLFDEGGDVVIGVGGLIGSTVFPIAEQLHKLGMWVDVDGYVQWPQYRDVMLTSIMKGLGQAHYDVINAAMNGKFAGCTDYVGSLANNGVAMADYHDVASQVPADLQAEVAALKADIISGKITDTGCISYPALCPTGLY
jgi:basic membrane protein A